MSQPTLTAQSEKTYLVNNLFLQDLTLEQVVTIKLMEYSVEEV